MADARAHRKTRDLYQRVSRTSQERWRSVLLVWRLERHVLCGVHHSGGRRLCALFWTIWPNRPARSDHHSNRSQARLLFPVALRFAVAASAVTGDACTPDRAGHRDRWFVAAAVFIW